jgi:hypothetical protein
LHDDRRIRIGRSKNIWSGGSGSGSATLIIGLWGLFTHSGFVWNSLRNFIFLFQSVGGLSPTSTTSSSSGLSSAGSSYPGDLAGHSPPLSESGSTRGKLHFAIFNKKTSGAKERKVYRDDFLDENVTFR